MPIIKHWQLVADEWQMLAVADAERVEFSSTAPGQILPLDLYLRFAPRLAEQQHRIGLLLTTNDDPESVCQWLARVSLVAVHFDHFTDGRGYSLARLIRQRYRFVGELRATGDVLRDQLYFLHQCGFDAFALRNDQLVAEALSGARDYSWGDRRQGHPQR
jgi:uncharacterized protein (DUF934 family)